MKTLEQQLMQAGLEVSGHCGHLSTFGPDMLQTSPLLQDMSAEEADILASAMLLVRAKPGQVLIQEGDVGQWMLLLLSGTVQVTKTVSPRKAAAENVAVRAEPGVEPGGGAGLAPGVTQRTGLETELKTELKTELNVELNAKSNAETYAELNSELAEPRSAANAPTISRIAVIQRGAAVGEMSMLDSEPRFATCTAIEAVEAGVLGRRAIGELIRDHPAVGAKLLVKITQLMAQRLRNTSNQLIRVLQKQAL